MKKGKYGENICLGGKSGKDRAKECKETVMKGCGCHLGRGL